jgi:16S rRNA (cytidine1402-2'-O)-methyltransferase
MNKKNRYDRLEEVKNDPRTLVFYEAPHKLIDTLKDMLKYFGGRHITLVRELTKIHEEIIYCTISDALKRFEEASPRGEFVIVVEGANTSPEKSYFWEEMSVEEHIQYYLSLGSKRMQAIRQVAKDRGISKEELNSKL